MVAQPSAQTNTGFAADEMGVYPISLASFNALVTALDSRGRLHTTHSRDDYIPPCMAVQVQRRYLVARPLNVSTNFSTEGKL
jgi:hypothetical protein